MQVIYGLLSLLDSIRLGIGSFFKGVALLCFVVAVLIILAMIAAAIIDMLAWNYWVYETGLFRLFMNPTYGRNDIGVEGIAALILTLMISGGICYVVGWVFRLGHNEQDNKEFFRH